MRTLCLTLLGAAALSLGCARGTSAAPTMRWVEELAPEHRWLAALGGDAKRGVYAAGRGLYRLDAQGWTLIPGSDSRAWRGLNVDDAGVWVVGGAGFTARLDAQVLSEHRAVGAAYDLLYVAGDAEKATATAVGPELWRWDGAAWTSSVEPSLAGLDLGALYEAPDHGLFVKGHPKATGKGSSVGRPNGSAWTLDNIGLKGHIQALDGTASDDVWAVGYTTKLFGKGGQAHHWDGHTWTTTRLPVDRPLWAVYATSRDEVWAGGADGLLLRWDGAAWKGVPTGLDGPITALIAPTGEPMRVIVNNERILRWQAP